MKKQLISTVGALMLTAGAFHGIPAEASQPVQKQHVSVAHVQGGQQAAVIDVTKLPEYAAISAKIDASAYSFKIVENQKVIRKMLLNDAQGRTQYKTIYNKNTKQLKIINTRGGLVSNETVTVKPAAPTVNKPAASGAVDLSKYTARVVTDNPNTKVTLYSDAQNRPVYKTILVKRTGAVKTIRVSR